MGFSSVDTSAFHHDRGDDAAVQAAILTAAALSLIEIELESETVLEQSSVVFVGVLEKFFSYWQKISPEDEALQGAHLRLERDDGEPTSLLLTADVFLNQDIRIPPDGSVAVHEAPLNFYLSLVLEGVYTCWTQISTQLSKELDPKDPPTLAEFSQLIRVLISPNDISETCLAFRWLIDSDSHFGINPSGVAPSEAHLAVIRSCRNRLSTKLNDRQDPGRLHGLIRLLHNELRLMATVATASASVFNNIDQSQLSRADETALAEGFNEALLPTTRVLAAEHLSYIRNRVARSSQGRDAAIRHFREACRLAHYAFNANASARYAKYVAQNLLEIATLNGDPIILRLSEIAWVDAYVMPYVRGLITGGDAPFLRLGWTSPIFTFSGDYDSIPPYSVDPDYVYTGSGARFIRDIAPSFAPDLWSGAVLLAQHYKDLNGVVKHARPDLTLALFAPADAGGLRFPLRDQHPVAWLYYLAEALVDEHESMRHPHAGLRGAYRVDLPYRQWFGGEMQAALSRGGPRPLRGFIPRLFPNVARYLLQESGKSDSRSDGWADLALLWGTQS